MKILIVEDEVELLNIIRRFLEKENYIVESASDYQSALNKIISYSYDCILLDIMLPGGSGLNILNELKSLGKAGNVIIISAANSMDDKIAGLDRGADDYLTKPFHLPELHARIRSLLRRNSYNKDNSLHLLNLTLNFDDRSAKVNGAELQLNRKEFDILSYFAVNKNRLINKASLAEHVWGDYMDQANDFDFIYSQIKNLRKKLKDAGAAIEIQAVYGIGYKLMME